MTSTTEIKTIRGVSKCLTKTVALAMMTDDHTKDQRLTGTAIPITANATRTVGVTTIDAGEEAAHHAGNTKEMPIALRAKVTRTETSNVGPSPSSLSVQRRIHSSKDPVKTHGH